MDDRTKKPKRTRTDPGMGLPQSLLLALSKKPDVEPPPIPKRAPASARPTTPTPTRTEYPTRPKSREKAIIQAAASPNVPAVVDTERMARASTKPDSLGRPKATERRRKAGKRPERGGRDANKPSTAHPAGAANPRSRDETSTAEPHQNGGPLSSHGSEPGPDTTPDVIGALRDLRDNTAGFIGAALADHRTGKSVASMATVPGFGIDKAAAVNTSVVRATLHAVKSLGVDGQIEDMLITVTGQYHLVRPVAKWPSMFWYLVLDRDDANLALARFALAEADANLKPRQKARK